MDAPTLGMAVNFYWNSPDSEGRQLMITTTELGLRMLRRSPVVGSIVLVDGSPVPSEELASICKEIDARYMHAGRELGLAEGYNHGWRALSEPLVGLMANDIIPHPIASLATLIGMMDDPEVGLTFPYLSHCDYSPQLERQSIFKPTMVTCEPASMTLNLCIFRRDLLERIGGVDEDYATGFYDPILVFKVRELGFRAVQVGDAAAVHLDRLTKATGGSGLTTAKHAQDTARFVENYPGMRAEHGIWPMSFWRWPMSTTRRATALWWLSQHVPTRPLRKVFQNLAVLLEPVVTRYPVAGSPDRTG